MAEALAGLTLAKLSEVAQLGLELWLMLLALAVGWRLFVQGNALEGMLTSRPGAGIEPDRLQLLMAMAGGVITYVVVGAQAVQAGAERMPDAPTELLGVMAASQAIYLGGKLGRRLRS